MSTNITADNGAEIKVGQLGITVDHPEGIASIWARLSDAQRVELAAALDPGRRGLHVRLGNQAKSLATFQRERDEAVARAQQPAQAVARADIEKAIRDEFLDWESQLEVRISRAVNHAWNLVSGADPAVHVVRESDLPAARVDGDYYAVASAKGDYKWPQHESSWWADRAQEALAEAARYTALARLAAREAVVDPVEAKARELWEATRKGGAPVATWADAHEDAQAQFRVLAQHWQEAGDE